MSAGGGYSSSAGNTRDIPHWAQQYFQAAGPQGMRSLNDFNQAGGSNGPLRDQAATTLSNEVTGAYLDPSNDPALQKIEANTQTQANLQYANDVNQIEGQAAKTGAYGNSGVPAAEAQAGVQLAADVGGQTAQLENQNYQQQAGLQAGAIGQAGGWNQQTLNDYLQMLNALRGISGSTSSSGYSANITI